MGNNNESYMGSPVLKGAGVHINFTTEQVLEMQRCAEDPIYFMENYVQIVSLDSGISPFKMYDFQKNIVKTIHENRFTVCKIARQSGKCVCINTPIKIRNKKTGEILDTTIGDVYNVLNDKSLSTSDSKFEQIIAVLHWEVWTPSGFQPFTSIGKTVPYEIWAVKTQYRELKCADNHIVYIKSQAVDNEIVETYTKDLQIGDQLLCEGDVFEAIVSVENTHEQDNMYDLLNVANGSIYYTNGVLSHNSTTTMCYVLHQILFNPSVSIAVLANKQTTAKNLLNMIKTSYENLPKWMQQGVVEWNKHSIQLENGAKVIVASTSSSAGRGGSHNIVILDEFAFVPPNIAEEFYSSVFPTISAGTNTKLVVISTPNGLNLFYKIWMDSVNDRNTFVRVDAKWHEVPGRGEAFKKEIMANFAGNKDARWSAEFEVNFLGSDDTLLSPAALASMTYMEPLVVTKDGLKVYETPIENNVYTICVDPSQGLNQDYHGITVINSTKFPYKVAAVFRNNQMSPKLLPNIIFNIAKQYNNAYTLIEVNDPMANSIAEFLVNDMEYENLIHVTNLANHKGQRADSGFGSSRSQKGIKMSYQVKNYGCSVMKDFIENQKFIINDFDLMSEFSTFVRVKNSFGASVGNNDDLVMTLVVFCWLTSQEFFKEINNVDVKQRLFEDRIKKMEDDVSLFGFIEDGIINNDDDADFDKWLSRDDTPKRNPDGNMEIDW